MITLLYWFHNFTVTYTPTLEWKEQGITKVTHKGKGVYTWCNASSWNITSEAIRYGTYSQGISQFYLHTYMLNLQLEWAIPAFAFPAITGTHLRTAERWKAELTWVAGYVVRQFTCPKAVTHPTTNQAQCRATALIIVKWRWSEVKGIYIRPLL